MRKSLYDRLGGEEALKELVKAFYSKVMADDRINYFFSDTDMDRQVAKVATHLSYTFGGSRRETHQDLNEAHQKMVQRGLNDTHFDAMMEDLREALVDLDYPPRLSADILATVEAERASVLGRGGACREESGSCVFRRLSVLGFGTAAYLLFLLSFGYAIGFLGNFLVPKSIDAAPRLPLATAIIIDLALIFIFGVQHSVMARRSFKRWWTRFVPEPVERSTYVLLSSLALLLLFWQWQPLGGTIWRIGSDSGIILLYSLFGLGWLLILASSLMINHWDLFGLRQAYLYFRQQPYTPVSFMTPGFYRWIRHPLYLGWLLTFWATPTMSAARLLFALATSAYVLMAIQFEERDLISLHGLSYARYRKEVPMLIPFSKGKSRGSEENSVRLPA